MTEYTTVSIPKELVVRVDDIIEGTTFSSTSDLVRFLLRSTVIQHERSDGDLSKAELQEIAEQLTNLGYLRWSTEASGRHTRAGSAGQWNAAGLAEFFLRWLGVKDDEF